MPTPMALQVVLGLGRSGIGAARLLHQRGVPVLVLESGDSPTLQQRADALRAEGIDVRLGVPLEPASFTALPSRPERVIVSPGIRWDHPTLEALRQGGIRTDGEITTAWEARGAVPWIGITGTNGKTTVTHLIAHLLQQAGLDAPMCGNVGFSAAELALERGNGQPPAWLVVELSSYQIESAPALAPRIGVWTTLTPDHLERHGTLDNYRAIKRSLLERSAVRILNGDDPDLRSRAASWDQARWVTAGSREQARAAGFEPHLWIEANQVCQASGSLLPADALAMPGDHNRQNMLMAVAVGLEVGLDASAMHEALRSFPGVPHRLELIRQLDGVAWFNDSKATNYDAAEVALKALPGPLVVLAGGEAKQGDAAGWLAGLQREARAVVVFGAAREAFQQLLQTSQYDGAIHVVEGLNEAVPLARRIAAERHCQAVLLSPACASFDQYRDFEARGEHFRQLVQRL
ncbi:MAG: UDP-N-acetylmuramoyl-L-alanine--D-glutamate ligase [Vulcanococcus sp.]|jgi:UDP-N-acetylmuramoylalanine--D-glutamate ligase|uniref:UDP-N-acetylmuramoyl-L-alanine--D-glutamate ligase n=1 Tax=Vulcanococcus sp. TaxID=2856995 RepID=UPI0025EE40B7|nr:UDP-N-acetylmuramoyl-L-alanine--D-glutamate ligase [Vulcanococcus sp.]MBW0180562.1 UDP-N-acetylmuramoyl-L-alanine--D-glutamate ligase [Vulcanococcus sp.]